jgi:hypothetical protein
MIAGTVFGFGSLAISFGGAGLEIVAMLLLFIIMLIVSAFIGTRVNNIFLGAALGCVVGVVGTVLVTTQPTYNDWTGLVYAVSTVIANIAAGAVASLKGINE